MKKEIPKRKVKKAEHRQIELRESLARAFQDVVRKAARKNLDLSFSIDGKIIEIEAKKLQIILSRHKNGASVKDLLHYAQTEHA